MCSDIHRFLLLKDWFTLQLSYQNVSIPVNSSGTPVVEGIGELSIATSHQDGLEPSPGKAIVPPGSHVIAQGGFGYRDGPFRRVVEDTSPLGNSGTDYRPGDDDTMIVVYLYPIVILDINLSSVFLTNPERFDAAGKG